MKSSQEDYKRLLEDLRRVYPPEGDRGRFSHLPRKDPPHVVEVRVCDGDLSWRVIKLSPEGSRWRYMACYSEGTFALEELVEAVKEAQGAPQPPRWIAAMRVARGIRPAKRTIEYRIGDEKLWCRVRRGLFGRRVEFTTGRNRISIKYGKLKKVVRTLNSIQEIQRKDGDQ